VGEASCYINNPFFSDFLDQIVLEPEPKAFRCWSWRQKM